MYDIAYAKEADLSDILALIKERIAWMDQKGMKQWNDGEYLTYYSSTYFLERIQTSQILIMKHQEQSVAMTGFFLDDERWNHDSRFIYLHHLTASLHYPGAGKELIKACEAEAKRLGKEGIRLDCQKGNTRINEFYQSLGYTIKGTITCGEYHGIKREKLF